jgi:ribonuclease HII
MGTLIGVDEAGYGPNLGPLVVMATRWNVPDLPDRVDLFERLAGCVTREKRRDDTRVWIADSKSVYNPSRGLADLERGVLSLWSLRTGVDRPANLGELWRSLDPTRFADRDDQPWYADDGPALPLVGAAPSVEAVERFRRGCAEAGVALETVRGRIVCPARFNQEVARTGTKGRMLSETTLDLVAELIGDRFDEPTLVLLDKHGGRNQYREFLLPWIDGRLPVCLEEGAERSRYRVDRVEFRFQAKSEAHFPVAAASMFAKYVRELTMEPFNRWWRERVPDLAPTAGYPVDAKRFWSEIEAVAAREGFPRTLLWRDR